MRCWPCPSLWWFMTGQTGLLMGSCCQLIPSLESCVSKYEKFRPCSNGSSENPIHGTRWAVQNATCCIDVSGWFYNKTESNTSVCEKYSSTFLFNSSSPIYLIGRSSSGQTLVASKISNSNSSCLSSGQTWMPNLHLGKAPLSIASYRSRRWKSGSCPASFRASSQTSEWTPRVGVRWNLTKWRTPSAFIKVYVFTPKPKNND